MQLAKAQQENIDLKAKISKLEKGKGAKMEKTLEEKDELKQKVMRLDRELALAKE